MSEPDAIRWRLTITGTSPLFARELVAATDAAAEAAEADGHHWQRLDDRTERRLGVIRLYLVTDADVTAEDIADALAPRYPTQLPIIAKGEPITWEQVRSRLRSAHDARQRYGHHRATQPA